MSSFRLQPGAASPVKNGRNSPLFCFLLLSPLVLGFVPAPLANGRDGRENKLSDEPRDLRLGVPSAKVGVVDDELRLCSCETLDAPVPAR